MKVLLVEPPSRINISNYYVPNLSLAYLVAKLIGAGHEVRAFISTLQKSPFITFERELREFSPELVGFSAPTVKIVQAAKMAQKVKEILPSAKTLVGGWHVSAIPQETIKSYPSFDLGIVGEAEDAVTALVDALGNGRTIESVAGTLWREKDGGVAARPPAEPPDINALPRPAWDLVAIERGRPMYRITGQKGIDCILMTQRGCPYKCSFCFKVSGQKVRERAIDDVLDEMNEGFKRYNPGGFHFFDQTFTLNRDRTVQFCEQAMRAKFHGKTIWKCSSRVDRLDRELLDLMYGAGCRVIQFGLESGSQEVLDALGKGTTLKQGAETIRQCREAGILTDTAFIIGLPHDNGRTVRETLNYMLSINPDFIAINSFTPYPETRAGELAEKGEANLRIIHRDWEKYDYQLFPTCEMRDMPAWRIFLFRLYAYLRFNLKPRKLKNLLLMFDIRSTPRMLFILIRDAIRGR